MVGPGEKPITNEAVYVFAGASQNLTLTTDQKGMASFSFDTANWTNSVSLQVGHRSSEPGSTGDT